MNTATITLFGNRSSVDGAALSLLSLSEHLALVDAFTRWAGFDVVFPCGLAMKELTVVKVIPKRVAIETTALKVVVARGTPVEVPVEGAAHQRGEKK